ncbi:peptidylprolyl isomerase [Actinotalea ferrariae]|uniref:peptidylprolyl isomerase n=1 Tax=Actinotalea ferrariae TaxID=1386098 RepID=UPI001C8B9A20|nr:peptidylprolyl isomerase [Actinotalea ferrariae]MBX9246863.1 peptidylprolyl isomerase [Actinotalea ferrariae]
MSPSKREREYARRRHEKWLARQAEIRAQRRRRRVIAGSALAGLALVAVVLVVVQQTGDDDATLAGPSPEVSQPATTETPLAEESTPPAVPAPDPALAEGRTWTGTLATTVGALSVELDGAAAPQAVASFVTLAREGFFDGTSCHRLTTTQADGIAVLQCGDPTGTGTGGPDWRFGPIENAPADDVYPAGTVAMARQGGDAGSMGSQFFLVYEDSTIPADAAGGYTVFGRITEGLDVLRAVADAGIAEGTAQTPATEVTIEGVEVQ